MNVEVTEGRELKLLFLGMSYGNDALRYFKRMSADLGYTRLTLGRIGNSNTSIREQLDSIYSAKPTEGLKEAHIYSPEGTRALSGDYREIIRAEEWDHIVFYQGPKHLAMPWALEPCGELAEELRENGNSCEIIFTAQTQEHAYEAYSVNAVQYILKPYHTQRLNFALARAMAQIKNTSPGYTVLRTSDGIRRVGWNEIVNSSTMGHYQIITLTDGTELKFRSTSDELYSMLEGSGYFMRVGSPYIVNVKRVREIASRELVLDNGAKIPLPKNSYKLISNTFIEMEERLRK